MAHQNLVMRDSAAHVDSMLYDLGIEVGKGTMHNLVSAVVYGMQYKVFVEHGIPQNGFERPAAAARDLAIAEVQAKETGVDISPLSGRIMREFFLKKDLERGRDGLNSSLELVKGNSGYVNRDYLMQYLSSAIAIISASLES